MELDTRLTSIFARLYRDLSKEDVQFMNYLLRVNLDHRWPKLKKVNAGTLLIKMKELELLKVDICHGECCLSCLTYLLGEIGRQDLASAVQDFGWLFYPTASTIPLSDTIPYKLDKSLTSVFARLYRELSKEDVRFMNYLLRVNFDHRWPKLKKVNADTLLLKMMELEIWKVDIYRGECRLWCLIRLLDEIGRRDLASAVQDFDNQLKTEWETDVKELFEEHSGYADDAMCVNNDGHDGRNGNAVADGNPLMLW